MDSEVLEAFLVAPGELVIHAEVRCAYRHSDKTHSQALLRVENFLQEGRSALLAHLEEIVAARSGKSSAETVYFLIFGLGIDIHNERGLGRLDKADERYFRTLEETLAVSGGDIGRGFTGLGRLVRDVRIVCRSRIASNYSDACQDDCRDEIDHIHLSYSY